MPKPLVVIVGPTASGKSDLAMSVAQKYDGEIICADSRTVYKGMDIGTAKPTARDQQLVSHHLLDVVEPNQPFNAAEFKKLALESIESINARGKLPILVGGTGLYINAVIFDYVFGGAADSKTRKQLLEKTIAELQAICSAKNIKLPSDPQNKRHLVRAVETMGPIQQVKNLRMDTFVVGIASDRTELHSRISARADALFSGGAVEEAAMLADRYGWDVEPMKANIYPIVRRLIDGQVSLEQAKQESVQSDMRLAKHQMTWFRANPHIRWGSPRQLLTIIEQFLSTY